MRGWPQFWLSQDIDYFVSITSISNNISTRRRATKLELCSEPPPKYRLYKLGFFHAYQLSIKRLPVTGTQSGELSWLLDFWKWGELARFISCNCGKLNKIQNFQNRFGHFLIIFLFNNKTKTTLRPKEFLSYSKLE